MKLPIFDNHIHLSTAGGGVESIKKFEKAGGTHCIVVNMPYAGMEAVRTKSFRAQYEETVRLCELVNKNASVKAFAVIGPYPVELLSLAEKLGMDEAKQVMLKGVDEAANLIEEGKAIGFGEIGRPHFPVSQEITRVSNEIVEYVFARAKDIGCAVVLHTERATDRLYKELSVLAEKAGIEKSRIVKHFASVDTVGATWGITPSLLASRDILNRSLFETPNFMLETDFLDDPKRPGAVLDITTVPKRTRQLLEIGVEEEIICKIMVELPKTVYGIEID